MESMKKMKKSLPTFTFGVDGEVKEVVAKSHDGLVVVDKGKGGEEVDEKKDGV
jgi:hypothetical protein